MSRNMLSLCVTTGHYYPGGEHWIARLNMHCFEYTWTLKSRQRALCGVKRKQYTSCSDSYVSWQRDTARGCFWAPAMQQSIDISCLRGPEQQTPPHAAASVTCGTDRRTDTVPLHRPYRILCEQCQWQVYKIVVAVITRQFNALP